MTKKDENKQEEFNNVQPEQDAQSDDIAAQKTEQENVTPAEPKPDQNADNKANDSRDNSVDTTVADTIAILNKRSKRAMALSTIAIAISALMTSAIWFNQQSAQQTLQTQLSTTEQKLVSAQHALELALQESERQTAQQVNQLVNGTKTELEQQKASLASLQQALSEVKGRRPNDWLLAESDYLMKLAGRKLFLERDAVSATELLLSADQRIAALNDPSLVPLRKALAQDITQLKGIPLIDREGLVIRLIALQRQVDDLPLANAILPESQVVVEREVSEDINDWQANLMTSLKDFSENFITFRTRDGNVIPLLSPEQHFYLRENIKAKIETAIKGVYDENQTIYQTSLKTAGEWSAAFFNTNANETNQFVDAINTLSEAKIAVVYPEKFASQPVLADVINERLRREVTSLIDNQKQVEDSQ